MGKLSSMAGGQIVAKQWDGWLFWVGMLLQSCDWVVFHQGVNFHVHEAHHAGEHVDIHVTQNGCQKSHVAIMEELTGSKQDSSSSPAGTPMTIHGLLSPCRLLTISANLGGGHGDLCSGNGNCVMSSWGGIAGSSLFSVTVGQSPLWAAIRDPLGWAHVLWLQLWLWLWWGSTRVGSASLGVVTSTKLEGTASARTSSSAKVTRSSIAHLNSNTLSTNWQGSPGISSWAFSAQYWRAFM